MKIRKITPWLINDPVLRPPVEGEAPAPKREYLFVKIETDEGLTGWGEVTPSTRYHNRAVWALFGQSNDLLVGDDASQIEAIWHKIFRALSHMGSRGAVTNLISGIDIALWDIRGKALGLPIYQLLGGRLRDRIALYTHATGPTLESIIESARFIVDGGYTTLKTDPFPQSAEEGATPRGYLSGQISAEAENYGLDVISAIREAVGPNIEILIDAHGRFNVPTAIRLANRLAEYQIEWFEEPVPVESLDALRQVKTQISVPICVGERLHTRYEFLPVLKEGLAEYIMPDVTWTGGITELRKISNLAETFYVPVAPHDASGPINVLAGSHVMATVPNFYKLEMMREDLMAYDRFIDPGLDIRQGSLYLSERPGLGIEMDEDFLSAHTVDTTGA